MGVTNAANAAASERAASESRADAVHQNTTNKTANIGRSQGGRRTRIASRWLGDPRTLRTRFSAVPIPAVSIDNRPPPRRPNTAVGCGERTATPVTTREAGIPVSTSVSPRRSDRLSVLPLTSTSRIRGIANIRAQIATAAMRIVGGPSCPSAHFVESGAVGLLTFGLNVTLDGCIDHTQGIVDDELHDYWTRLMDQSGAMLFGRNTYELMEAAWPAVARDEKAPRAMREWAQKLEAKAKYVVSSSRSEFPWLNTIKVEGDLRQAISALKAKTERGVLVGAPMLATALEELRLIDEYRIVVHPVVTGRGPTLFHGLSNARHLELLSTQRFESGVQALHLRRKAE